MLVVCHEDRFFTLVDMIYLLLALPVRVVIKFIPTKDSKSLHAHGWE